MDRTIQLKKFSKDADDPFEFLEWRNVTPFVYESIDNLLRKSMGEPMDRSGD
jgi:hypothetical protein